MSGSSAPQRRGRRRRTPTVYNDALALMKKGDALGGAAGRA